MTFEEESDLCPEAVKEHAKKINEAYEKYEQATNKLPINKENLEEFLYTYVNY
jgi:hypothetical protein